MARLAGNAREECECQVQAQCRVVGCGLGGLAQAHDFGMRIDRRGVHLDFGHVFDGRGGLDAVVLQELAQLGLGQGAWESVHQLPVLDQHHGRDGADLEGAGQLLLGFDVDLRQAERAVVLGSQLLEDRAERLARAAPLGPEIDQHRDLQGGLEDLGLEGGGGGVEDVGGVGHWRGSLRTGPPW